MLTKFLGSQSGEDLSYARLAIGCAIVAVVVSLGTVAGMRMLGMEINAAIPAALGAVGAASYAAATARR